MDGVGFFFFLFFCFALTRVTWGDSSQKPAMTGSITFYGWTTMFFFYYSNFYFFFCPLLLFWTWRLFECSEVFWMTMQRLVLFQCHGPPGPAICFSSLHVWTVDTCQTSFLFCLYLIFPSVLSHLSCLALAANRKDTLCWIIWFYTTVLYEYISFIFFAVSN